ncbi:MAG TPA: hypothetical protein VM073_08035 [Usitatibacter sp.]|nr:hypothetical protein [Usitatibacter sp.]
MIIPGSCHCGNISFELIWEPDPAEIPARACGCSFCVKHGGLWTSNPRGAVKVRLRDPGKVTRYTFGTRTAEFLICSGCGVVPVATSAIDGVVHAVVSVHAFNGVDPAMLRPGPISFDGEGTDTRLARRKRSWIPSVEIVEGTA